MQHQVPATDIGLPNEQYIACSVLPFQC